MAGRLEGWTWSFHQDRAGTSGNSLRSTAAKAQLPASRPHPWTASPTRSGLLSLPGRTQRFFDGQLISPTGSHPPLVFKTLAVPALHGTAGCAKGSRAARRAEVPSALLRAVAQ